MFGNIFQKSILYPLYNNLAIFRVKKVYPIKIGKIGLQNLQNGESFFGEKPLNIDHGLNFAPKSIPGLGYSSVHAGLVDPVEYIT